LNLLDERTEKKLAAERGDTGKIWSDPGSPGRNFSALTVLRKARILWLLQVVLDCWLEIDFLS
jgi:hypothetical protein